MNAIVDSLRGTPAPRRTRAAARTFRLKTSLSTRQEIAALNEHPLNCHALKLLPKWSLKSDATQLHLITLATAAKFATGADAAMLEKMRTEWSPTEAMEYFARVDTFDDLFVAQYRPLEAAQVILAAVNIIAEPHRYLPSFQLG